MPAQHTKGGGADLDWVKAAIGTPDSRVASIFQKGLDPGK